MRLLANGNLPLASVRVLEKSSHNIIHVGSNYSGIKDDEVMNLSIEQDRTIVTFDKDYGELIFKYKYRPPAGVIYLRLNSYTPDEPSEIVTTLLNTSTFNPAHHLTVITDSKIRQRKC